MKEIGNQIRYNQESLYYPFICSFVRILAIISNKFIS